MEFGLSESQKMLKDNARKFFAGECPMAEVRRLMETETAYDEALWAKMAEQGYTGINFPEEYDGVGLGKVELILLMEEAGRALLPAGVAQFGGFDFEAPHEWSLEALLGNLRSTSFLSRAALGERHAAFEAELSAALLAVDPSARFAEAVSSGYTLARKPTPSFVS